MKALSLRLSIGVLFALVGLFLGLFATARPLNDPTIRRCNDATDRQHAPFPTIQIQPVASGFASPVTVTNAGDGSGRLFIVEQFGRIQIFINAGRGEPNCSLSDMKAPSVDRFLRFGVQEWVWRVHDL